MRGVDEGKEAMVCDDCVGIGLTLRSSPASAGPLFGLPSTIMNLPTLFLASCLPNPALFAAENPGSGCSPTCSNGGLTELAGGDTNAEGEEGHAPSESESPPPLSIVNPSSSP